MIGLGLLLLRANLPNTADIDAIVQKHLAKTGAPGSVVLVQQGNTVVYGKGFGVAEVKTGRRPNIHTPFLIASLTKQFTAVLVCRLVEQGKLALNDPVTKWFPEAPPTWAGMTVRHLLTHTSGVTILPKDPTEVLRNTPEPVMRQRIVEAPLTAPPGTEYGYSNSGYVLLGMIIEQVTGKTYSEVLQREILKPLGMRETGMMDWDHPPRNLAVGYEVHPSLSPAEKIHPSWTYSAGAMVSTAADVGRWLVTMQSDRLLKTTRNEMFTQLKLNNGADRTYGFGWVVLQRGSIKVVSHTGQLNGFSSHDLFTPNGISIVVLANATDGEAATLANDIAERYVPELVPPAIKDPSPTRTAGHRHFLEELLDGRVDRSHMTPQFSQFFTDDQVAQMGQGLSKLGHLTSMELTGTETKGTLRRFEYRVKLGETRMSFTVVIDSDDKIAALHIE